MDSPNEPFDTFNWDAPTQDPTLTQFTFDPTLYESHNNNADLDLDLDLDLLANQHLDNWLPQLDHFQAALPDSSVPGCLPFPQDQFETHEPANSLDFNFNTVGSSVETTPSPRDVVASPTSPTLPPKIGTRFSKESLRILRNWLSTHGRHPFPNDDEKRLLQLQTGLTKTQILNWLANARRRGKIPDYAASSRRQDASAEPLEIPQRPGTPAPRHREPSLNPLERWVDSPPEHEPASATAIARAMASSPPLDANRSYGHYRADSGSESSLHRSSRASSIGTSHSSGQSAYSHDSRDSGSLAISARRHLRRKRRAVKKRNGEKTTLVAPTNTFQCTFCTETFSSKHTWQRHEKSLHLALERWVCAPYGPKSVGFNGADATCIFCDQLDPDIHHIESHNYAACQERALEDRTFHRKDHLGQHLRLVHNVATADLEQLLKDWKMETPQIRSTCGFCGITMDTWAARSDHLADHFKTGKTMEDWKGDWGFDAPILSRVENSIAPYLIALERNSPFPFEASNTPLDSPPNAYELIKLEVTNFVEGHYDKSGQLPTAEELQLEACRIIFAAEVPSYYGVQCFSWLRDLIMSSDGIVRKAKLSPLRLGAENRLSILKIVGKNHPFESCPLEAGLLDFVQAGQASALDGLELQQEASRIIRQMENDSTSPSDIAAIWLLELARSSTAWLNDFRQRANIPLEGVMITDVRADSTGIDSIIQSYNELGRRLAEYLDTLRAHGVQPDDLNLRQKSLSIISEFDNDEWKQMAANNSSWFDRFKRKHLPWSSAQSPRAAHQNNTENSGYTEGQMFPDTKTSPGMSNDLEAGLSGRQPAVRKGPYFLDDLNFDRWVARELARWAAATMSPHNPNRRVPTDEELQHQARWILYEDGDPFNQTAADNAEWLRRFKREVGILKDGGPGLLGGELLGVMPGDNTGLAKFLEP